jgi:hypothetical protein
MSVLKVLVVAAIVAGGYYAYTKNQRHAAAGESAEAVVSANGFVLLPAVNDQGSGVLVFAAQGCPLEDAARADQLAADLKSSGIPVRRTNDIGFTMTSPDPGAVQRMQVVMNGQLPIVFVNGRGKANPTLSEVLAEYRGR